MKHIMMVFCAVEALAQVPTGEYILERIDQNMSSRNRVLTARMVIHGRRESRTIGSRSWVEGTEKAFTEYLSPAREKGTKMLKLKDQLWLYSPSADRIIEIAGHMLRQSVMGSDLSYEDMMDDPRLTHRYRAEVTGSEDFEGSSCWIVSLTAKTEDIAYYSRKLWVDKGKVIPLKEELYARSGKLLKRLELAEVKKIHDRWFPMRMLFKDMLGSGEGTEFIIETVAFDQEIPGYLFSKASLKK